MLPPLNARLAADLVADAAGPAATGLPATTVDALVDTLTRISALACALPWVRSLTLDPVMIVDARVYVGVACFDVDPRQKLLRGYPHMAIHPYPVELIGDVVLRDGTTLHVRPIRPEDAELERAFVNGLSEQTRYYRFFYRLAELTPAMLARFTQVDYDRELALVALDASDDTTAQAFVGVARYIANPDRTSAEFAVVVADAWQRRGVARVLMRGLIVARSVADSSGFQERFSASTSRCWRSCARWGSSSRTTPRIPGRSTRRSRSTDARIDAETAVARGVGQTLDRVTVGAPRFRGAFW